MSYCQSLTYLDKKTVLYSLIFRYSLLALDLALTRLFWREKKALFWFLSQQFFALNWVMSLKKSRCDWLKQFSWFFFSADFFFTKQGKQLYWKRFWLVEIIFVVDFLSVVFTFFCQTGDAYGLGESLDELLRFDFWRETTDILWISIRNFDFLSSIW